MKVKDLISTAKKMDDGRLLYYCIESPSFDVIFTENTIHHIEEEVPHILEKEVEEWNYDEQCDPYTRTLDADTLYITTK